MNLLERLGFELKSNLTDTEKQERILAYKEEFGIVCEFKEKGNRAIFYENHSKYLGNKKHTVKVTLRLNSMTEERQVLTKWRERDKYTK